MNGTEALDATDKLEIHELIARYNRAVDAGDADGWVDTFTEDGVFESLLVGTFRGRQQLTDFARRFGVEQQYASWAGGQHWIGNIIVEGAGDRAEVFSYHLMFVPRDDEVPAVLMAAHEDVVVRTDHGWRFALRRLVPWPPRSDRERWRPGRTPS